MAERKRRINRRRRTSARNDGQGQTGNAFRVAADAGPRPAFRFLDDGARQQLAGRAFELLGNHGIVVNHQGAAAALEAAGARRGRDGDRLRLPREMLAEALAATPRTAGLYGKRPERNLGLPRADQGFIMRSGTGAHGYVEPGSGDYRNMDLSAVDEIAAVCNGLDEVGFIAHPFVHGVAEQISDIYGFARLIARTDKHVWIQPYQKQNIDYLMRIAAVAAGGEQELRDRPLASCITCSFSPLEFKPMDTEAIILSGRFGLPLHACSLPTAGGTAPLSDTGTLVMAVAEVLAMVTQAHVLAPGTPVIATPLMFTLDMRTGSALQACVESLRAAAMAIEVLKGHFGLLAHTYGAGSDTPDLDGQSMAERALLGQGVALAGADILGGLGQLECATVFSPVQAVLDNEVGALLRAFIRPPALGDDDLNWQEMSNIGAGAHFLDSLHTLEHCRSQHQPTVFLRQDRDGYEKSHRRNATDVARERALALIAAAPPEGVLDEAARHEIADLVATAERHILEAANSPVVNKTI